MVCRSKVGRHAWGFGCIVELRPARAAVRQLGWLSQDTKPKRIKRIPGNSLPDRRKKKEMASALLQSSRARAHDSHSHRQKHRDAPLSASPLKDTFAFVPMRGSRSEPRQHETRSTPTPATRSGNFDTILTISHRFLADFLATYHPTRAV